MSDQPATTPDSSSNLLAILAWLLGLFTSFIAPLVIYVMYNGKAGPGDQLVREAARHSLNWQLTVLIISIIAFILMFTVVLSFIGFLLAWVLGCVNVVFCVIGVVKAAQGEAWKSWITIPIIK